MEVKGLRIGNYVKEIYHNNILKVTAITTRCTIKGVYLNRENYSSMSCSNIAATSITEIPLTEDWLLKLGFELDDDFDDYNFGFMSIKKENDNFYYNPISEYYDSMKIQISYVHQLQNLYFALTCEELKEI